MKHMYKSHVTGSLGEELACTFLMKHGFEVICRNYRKKFGEIDIVARKLGKGSIAFFEVKTVTCVTFDVLSREAGHKPEDNVHEAKRRRLAKTIECYLLQHFKTSEYPWEFGVITVYINENKRVARIKPLFNIVL